MPRTIKNRMTDDLNSDIQTIEKLSRLFNIGKYKDIIQAVNSLSEKDAKTALIMALLYLQQGTDAQSEEDSQDSNVVQDKDDTHHQIVSEKPSPDTYELTITEHNLALMMMFTLDSCPSFYSEQAIHGAVNKAEKPLLHREKAIRLFTDCRRSFSRHFRQEKDEHGYTSPSIDLETGARTYTTNPETPATNILYTFKVKDPLTLFLNDKPNLGDIRAAKPVEIADNPSEGFVQFLKDLADYYAGMPNKNYPCGSIIPEAK